MTTNNNVMREDAPAPQAGASAPPENPDQRQTVEIPLSACPTPPKPGQVLNFKVISIDQNQKVINAVCTDYDQGQGGSDSLAAEFNQPPKSAAQPMK
jgi:hypothetical protein